jgi:hypothetical protein
VPVVYTYLDDFGAWVGGWVKNWNAAPEEATEETEGTEGTDVRPVPAHGD